MAAGASLALALALPRAANGAQEAAPAGPDVHGWLTLQYRLRAYPDRDPGARSRFSAESDQDAHGTFALLVGDAQSDRFAAAIVSRADWKLDGSSDRRGAPGFDGLADTYSSDLTGQLQEAWVGGKGGGPLGLWKAGRLFLDDAPVATTIDGLRAQTAASAWLATTIGAYGGVPVHFYESSPRGDAIAGAFAEARPWSGARARLDAMHLDDPNRLGDHHDDLLAASLWQSLPARADLFARFTALESEPRDLALRGSWRSVDDRTRASISWDELLRDQRDHSLELDPCYEIAFEERAYRQLGVTVGRELSTAFDVAAGADVRRLRDRAREGDFNHDFTRLWIVPTWRGWAEPKSSAALHLDWWRTPDERTAAYGLDLSHPLSDDVTGRAGTSYALWKYDLFQQRERDGVRTLYAGADWRATNRIVVRGDWTYELNESEHFHTLRISATWTF